MHILTRATLAVAALLALIVPSPSMAALQVDAAPAAVAHYNAGVGFFRDSRNNQAVEEFRQAIHIDPGFAEAHANLGYALSGSDAPAAIQQLRLATRLNPGLAEAHNTLGALLYRQRQYPAAAAEYRTVLTLHPDSVAGHYNLGLALAKMGQPQDAIAEFQRAVALQPGFTDARLDLGQALYQTGRKAEARAQWQTVTRSGDADNAKTARYLLARHQ